MSTTADVSAGDLAVRGILIMADGKRSDFDAVIHPDAVNLEGRIEPPECRVGGPAGFYATARWLRTAFEGLAYEIHDVVANGNLVAVSSTMSGRQVAPFAVYTPDGGVDTVFPPTGKTFAITQSHWFRIEDGKLVEHWANRDDLGQAKQLGWVPPTPAYLFRMTRAKSRLRRTTARL
jgi:predicted ester cyclase